MSKNKGNGIKQMFTQKIYLVTIPAQIQKIAVLIQANWHMKNKLKTRQKHQKESETLLIYFHVKTMWSQSFEFLSPVILVVSRNKTVCLLNECYTNILYETNEAWTGLEMLKQMFHTTLSS